MLGVSDKTVTQYMAESAATRPKRVQDFLVPANAKSNLYTGVGLEEANRQVMEFIRTADDGPNGTWSLQPNIYVNAMYYSFSSKGRIKPGRLTPECERKLLEYYWKHCEIKNDIATARQCTWWVTGSENHDANFKMSNLISSQIFMHEPDYAKRIYPDLGRMQGYGYGEGSAFRTGAKAQNPPLGNGNYKDGKSYNAADHYKAWVAFWKEYFAERARHGFFIEHNAQNYMVHTHNFLHSIYTWCEDEELRRETRMFFDLVWAQWAQDQAAGITGGAVNRGSPGYTAMGQMAEFLMGAPAGRGPDASGDYEWPREVWEMVLGRSAMGEYAFVSRKPNEAQDVWLQPPGTEHTMIVRPDSRLVRYSWATPDYVMGTRMDHPNALYCHLWASAEAITFPAAAAKIEWSAQPNMVAQDRNVAILQIKKSFSNQCPRWFPQGARQPAPLTMHFIGLEKVEEKGGWVFAQQGNAYAAIRVVLPAAATMQPNTVKGNLQPTTTEFDKEGLALYQVEPNAYTWDQKASHGNSRTLMAKDVQAAVIIEASRKAHHATLEAFEQDILDNPIRLKRVVRSYVMTYRGCGKDAKELFLNTATTEVPMIGGQCMRYDCPTFDSPWLHGDAGSGVVTLTGPLTGKRLVLDFNAIQRQESDAP